MLIGYIGFLRGSSGRTHFTFGHSWLLGNDRAVEGFFSFNLLSGCIGACQPLQLRSLWLSFYRRGADYRGS